MNTSTTNLSATKDGTYNIANPSKESSENLRQLLEYKKFALIVKSIVTVATLIASMIVAIMIKSYWPLVTSPLVESINYLKQLRMIKPPK